jgi:hypothetical protein
MDDLFFEFSESEKVALAALADTKGVDIEQVEADFLKKALKGYEKLLYKVVNFNGKGKDDGERN